MRRLHASALLAAALVAAALAACTPAPRIAAPPAPTPVAAADTARDVPDSLVTASGTLYGTLRLPAGRGPWPVVLVHPGSGPTDRDGNSTLLPGPNNGLKMLAEALADRGVATLRIDKRAIGASAAAATSEADLRFDTYTADTAAWLERLRADRRFSRIVALGHSEGAHVVTRAAAHGGARVDGLVLVAGAGRPAGAVLREQLRPQLPPALYVTADSILTRLEAGETNVAAPAVFAALFRPSVQPYLASWLALDPAADLAATTVPALVVQGTNDVQVSMVDAERLAASRANVRLVRIDGMNHILKAVSGDVAAQVPSYSDPALPLAPGLAEAVAAFVLGLQ